MKMELQKAQEKLEREREKEMVDKRRIVLAPRGAIPSAISSPRVRYLEPGSRARESRERREAGASCLSATCAKPPVCVPLLSGASLAPLPLATTCQLQSWIFPVSRGGMSDLQVYGGTHIG